MRTELTYSFVSNKHIYPRVECRASSALLINRAWKLCADTSFRLNLSGNKEETFLHGAFPPCEGRAFFGFGAYLPTKQSGIIGRGAYVENRHNGFAVRSPILFI